MLQHCWRCRRSLEWNTASCWVTLILIPWPLLSIQSLMVFSFFLIRLNSYKYRLYTVLFTDYKYIWHLSIVSNCLMMYYLSNTPCCIQCSVIMSKTTAVFPVMPTVELNALAMKLCQPAVYTSVPPVPLAARPLTRGRWPPPFPRLPGAGGTLIYRVKVAVGGRAWLGEGANPQAARHDAAARALHDLRQKERPPVSDPSPPPDAGWLN